MGLDYLDYGDYRKRDLAELGELSRFFVERFQAEFGEISYFGTGPRLEDCFAFEQAQAQSANRDHAVIA